MKELSLEEQSTIEGGQLCTVIETTNVLYGSLAFASSLTVGPVAAGVVAGSQIYCDQIA